MSLFVSCPPGLEELLAEELQGLGIPNLDLGSGGVYAPQKMSFAYKINYCSRLAIRVLWPLLRFPCKDRHDLYRGIGKIDWTQYLNANKTFAIDAHVSSDTLRHSLYAAQITKDALCDQLRERIGRRPTVDTSAPDVQLNLFIEHKEATLSFDMSGEPLYKRGYRFKGGQAPLQETVAAALLYYAAYQAKEVFCDPCCGSGTLLIEAAMQATKTPAGFFRKEWGLFHHPDFSQEQWYSCKREADGLRKPLARGKLIGVDSDPRMIELCRTHLSATGFASQVELVSKEISAYHNPLQPTLVISNLPYGKRLEVPQELYGDLAKFVREKCSAQVRTYFLAPQARPLQRVGFRVLRSMPLNNGGLQVYFYALTPSLSHR